MPGPRPGLLQRPDGARLALYTSEPAAGTPDLTLILSHGWSASARIWAGYAQALHARDHRLQIVTYDQRGHGASTPGTRPASMHLLAQDLQAVIATAAPHNPVVVAGHSMGGMALLTLAAQAPHLLGHPVAGVLLAATSSGHLDLTAPTYPPFTRALGATRHAISAICLHAPRPAQHLRDLLRPPSTPRPAIATAAHWYRAVTAHDVTGRLGPLADIPVRIVTGDADRLIPPIHSLRLAAQISSARLHVIPGAGHRLPTDHPEALLKVLVELCAEARTPATSQARS